MKKLMTHSEIDDALSKVYELHAERVWPIAECWGWGAVEVSGPKGKCDDCGRPQAGLRFANGENLCWRDAFWRHMGICERVRDAIPIA